MIALIFIKYTENFYKMIDKLNDRASPQHDR